MTKDFFEERSDQSEIKTILFCRYFEVWMNIVGSRAQKVSYMDLFAGPGTYLDGSTSTPIQVVERIINHEEWRKKVFVVCNDANEEYSQNLAYAFANLPDINTLKYKPIVLNSVVGQEIAENLENMQLMPTLSFVDPWGYKGLSHKLIRAMTKDWGSDCIFFFNYDRINRDLTNPLVYQHVDAIFGADRANGLRERIKSMSSTEREQVILNELAEVLSENRRKYVLPFRFMRRNQQRTSHYLIFVSKNETAYKIMKDLMYDLSTEFDDGVASFSYIPVLKSQQLSLLSLLDRPLDNLADELLEVFRGKSLTVKKIIDLHHVNTPFVPRNYKEALRRLEENQRITCNPSKRQIRNDVKTMGDNVMITFP